MFDTIDHGYLREMLSKRIRDGVLIRLIGKWLNAGVMHNGMIEKTKQGSPQGGELTPLTEWKTFRGEAASYGMTFVEGRRIDAKKRNGYKWKT